jgi:hypothetical protein
MKQKLTIAFPKTAIRWSMSVALYFKKFRALRAGIFFFPRTRAPASASRGYGRLRTPSARATLAAFRSLLFLQIH